MNSDNVDEDSIDVEALQAQIDLSMSFAQNLVSSWMDPRKFPTSSRRNDLEKELSEYMKRPSRLGVGASIPEGHQSISRETARLKGKLVGSKRPREEGEIVSPKAEPDDEHESRVTAIKKKSRSDPFNVVHGKKKKKTKATPASPQPGPLPQEFIPQSPTRPSFEQKTEVPAVNGFSHLDASPKKKKKRKKVAEGERDELLTGLAATSQQDPSHSVRERTPPLLPAISPPPSTPQQDLDEVHEKLMIVSPTTPTSPLLNLCLGESIAADLLKRPLLNLTGPPPSDEESDANVAGTPSTSPKKKRKRRKKKKHHASGDPLATAPSTASTIPAS